MLAQQNNSRMLFHDLSDSDDSDVVIATFPPKRVASQRRNVGGGDGESDRIIEPGGGGESPHIVSQEENSPVPNTNNSGFRGQKRFLTSTKVRDGSESKISKGDEPKKQRKRRKEDSSKIEKREAKKPRKERKVPALSTNQAATRNGTDETEQQNPARMTSSALTSSPLSSPLRPLSQFQASPEERCLICMRDWSGWTEEQRARHIDTCAESRAQGGSTFTLSDRTTAEISDDDDFAATSAGSCVERNDDLRASCPVCTKDLSHLSATRRSLHCNRCLNEQKDAVAMMRKVEQMRTEKDTTVSFSCSSCGQELASLSLRRREEHVKWCKGRNMKEEEEKGLDHGSEKSAKNRKSKDQRTTTNRVGRAAESEPIISEDERMIWENEDKNWFDSSPEDDINTPSPKLASPGRNRAGFSRGKAIEKRVEEKVAVKRKINLMFEGENGWDSGQERHSEENACISASPPFSFPQKLQEREKDEDVAEVVGDEALPAIKRQREQKNDAVVDKTRDRAPTLSRWALSTNRSLNKNMMETSVLEIQKVNTDKRSSCHATRTLVGNCYHTKVMEIDQRYYLECNRIRQKAQRRIREMEEEYYALLGRLTEWRDDAMERAKSAAGVPSVQSKITEPKPVFSASLRLPPSVPVQSQEDVSVPDDVPSSPRREVVHSSPGSASEESSTGRIAGPMPSYNSMSKTELDVRPACSNCLSFLLDCVWLMF